MLRAHTDYVHCLSAATMHKLLILYTYRFSSLQIYMSWLHTYFLMLVKVPKQRVLNSSPFQNSCFFNSLFLGVLLYVAVKFSPSSVGTKCEFFSGAVYGHVRKSLTCPCYIAEGKQTVLYLPVHWLFPSQNMKHESWMVIGTTEEWLILGGTMLSILSSTAGCTA